LSAALIILISLAGFYLSREKVRQELLVSELADLHVAALASSTPVDVVSTDRHTVKPWFEGKIPFSFNLPELSGTDFSLVGGRVTYLGQTPGAHLIYRVRKHEISVFIFPDRSSETANLPLSPITKLSFTVASWAKDGLRYFVIGDVSASDVNVLNKLLREAA
jgi:anti-sigma factor RsiW